MSSQGRTVGQVFPLFLVELVCVLIKVLKIPVILKIPPNPKQTEAKHEIFTLPGKRLDTLNRSIQSSLGTSQMPHIIRHHSGRLVVVSSRSQGKYPSPCPLRASQAQSSWNLQGPYPRQ